MSDFIALDLNGVDHLAALLRDLPPSVRSIVIDDVSKYVLNVFRTYPSYQYVSRKKAYGSSFFTEKQRRWFWANKDQFFDASGNLIKYKRTQALRDGWQQIGRGVDSIIANETPYAGFMMGDEEQSRHAAAIGWKQVGEIVEARRDRIDAVAQAGAKKAIKKLGL